MSHDDTEGLRPSLRPWILGALINLGLAGGLLGYPYLRGPERAEAVAPRFAAFAACFYDAEARPSPGLGLPRGERGRYASLVVSGPADWPARCVPALRAIPPEESRFLFPGVKNAEAQLRSAVDLMATELEALAADRAAGRAIVPHRPTRAMAALRGALAELGLSSGVDALRADHDAIAIADGDHLATPSIIPLRVSRGGEWQIARDGAALLAGTMDTRAAVFVRVEGGGVAQRVTRRPRLVSGMLAAQSPPWLVWSTSRSQCAREEGGCARRATGLAAFLEDRQTLEPMVWVGAHPRFTPWRAIHVAGQRAWVIAETEDGSEVRAFELPEPEVRPLGAEREPPRLDAVERWEVLDGRTAAWLPGDPPWVAVAGADGAQARSLGDASPIALPLPGRTPVIRACGDASRGWLVVGTEAGAVAVRAPDGAVRPLPAVRLDPAVDGALDVACDGDALEVFSLDRGRLSAQRCGAAACEPPRVLADADVRAFDGVVFGGEPLAAWTDDPEAGPVWLSRADGSRTLPAPCWTDPMDGLCGEPRLAAGEGGLTLVTRQGEDLRVLRSDDGARWTALSGLEQP